MTPALIERFERVRQPRVCSQEPRDVFVLSRVTLGADVCVTEHCARCREAPVSKANIYFVGSRKNWELFAGMNEFCTILSHTRVRVRWRNA